MQNCIPSSSRCNCDCNIESSSSKTLSVPCAVNICSSESDYRLASEALKLEACEYEKSETPSDIGSAMTVNKPAWFEKLTSRATDNPSSIPVNRLVPWLETTNLVNDGASAMNDEPIEPLHSISRCSSGRHSGKCGRALTPSTFTDDLNKLSDGLYSADCNRPCTKHLSRTNFNPIMQELELQDVCDDELIGTPSRESSAKHGRRANSAMDQSHIAIQDSSETKTKMHNQNSGESSNCFQPFEHVHKGQLPSGLTEGDILDVLAPLEKPKRITGNHLVNNSVEAPSQMDSEFGFVIPELPEGQEMVINIKTTWGDWHYVGLNGIEIFGADGKPVQIEKIWADPADINILPEYSQDTRVVQNLIDGVYRTKDDMHLWLTPFTPGQDHVVSITFVAAVQLALIRIWNYNKSRIHSYRGAKDIEITFDGKLIFKGEIARACGGLQGSTDAFGDTILFTTDDDILEKILAHDTNFVLTLHEAVGTWKNDVVIERPQTGDLKERERPFTSGTSPVAFDEEDDDSHVRIITCHDMELHLLSNWGDDSAIGLTGLEVLGKDGDAILLDTTDVRCTYISGVAVDPVNIHRLLDAVNVTADDGHMWSVPFSGEAVLLHIKFSIPMSVIGLRLWNYNKSVEDCFIGVKFLRVWVNGKTFSPAVEYLVRRGPGHCHFDFAQEILFSVPPSWSLVQPFRREPQPIASGSVTSAGDDYEPTIMPRGFVFQLQLFSTWGDPYYLGLTGIEVYDALGKKIPLMDNNIVAYPDSVNVLTSVSDDVRTPDKLVDGVNTTQDGRHMWLAPVLPNILNRVYIIFDFPVTISMMKIWNYSKTPTRGVKEFACLVDDLLVYSGILDQATPNINEPTKCNLILFTDDRDILKRELTTLVHNHTLAQDVELTYNGSHIHQSQVAFIADQALRPFTSIPSTRSPQQCKKLAFEPGNTDHR